MKLHRDLQPSVTRGTLRHPLLGHRRYVETFNTVYNREYESKKALLQQAVALGNWRGVIWLHDRHFRVQALLNYSKAMPDEEFWRLAGEVWVDSDNIRLDRRAWTQIWTSERAGRDQIMTSAEHRLLAKLPDCTIAIYRGYPTSSALHGLSWTYDRETAMAAGHPFLASATVRKLHIEAFFSGRRPSRPDELVVLSRHCRIIDIEQLTSRGIAA